MSDCPFLMWVNCGKEFAQHWPQILEKMGFTIEIEPELDLPAEDGSCVFRTGIVVKETCRLLVQPSPPTGGAKCDGEYQILVFYCIEDIPGKVTAARQIALNRKIAERICEIAAGTRRLAALHLATTRCNSGES
ncbi:MAG TPA: hypothetical protein VKU82_03785 [Planctomycetaceae bacterium]|nr:hypothetical protein [Planctomycetaceae bacterium]